MHERRGRHVVMRTVRLRLLFVSGGMMEPMAESGTNSAAQHHQRKQTSEHTYCTASSTKTNIGTYLLRLRDRSADQSVDQDGLRGHATARRGAARRSRARSLLLVQ